jgi:cell division protein FtsW
MEKKWKFYDYSLIIIVVLLSLFSLVMVYSASMVSAIQRYGVASDYFFDRQKYILIGGGLLFLFFARANYKSWANKYLLMIMLFGIISVLIGLFVFGHVSGNAQSWIRFGSLSIQPSEFAKPIVIIYLSAVYAKKQSYINDFNRGVVPPLMFLVVVMALIAFQPDYGTAGVIGLISIVIILLSGMNIKNILRLVGIGAILLFIIFLVNKDNILSDERKSRITSYDNPFTEAQDSGYHLVNSYLAIGSGGVNGLGLGKSIQKLGYLPESHTDFIMAVIAEELGLWGVGFVLLCLATIVLKGLLLGMKCKDPFGSLLAIGISSMIGIQSFINLGGISGLIPLTGVPLPFVSYGGSSFWQLAIAVGILVNISKSVNLEYASKQQKNEKVLKNSHTQHKPISFRS